MPPRPKARVDSISQQPVPLEGLTCALLANSLTLKNDQEELRDLIEKNPELVADATDFMETPNPGVFLRIDPKTQEQTTCRMLKIDPATCVPEQLEIRKLPELGHGVFAKENLAARTYLAPYFGTTRLEKPGHPDRSTKYMWDVLVYNVGSDKDSNGRSNQTALVIDADPAGNYTRLINSSESSPNLDFEVMALTHLDGTVSYQIVYKVKKPIRTGEQLLISYGKDYWKGLTDENGQSITPKQINPKTFLVIDGQVCKWNFKQQTYDPVVLNM